MVVSIQVNGKIIKKVAKEFICGQMEGNMKENLVMINKMGLANAIILMEKSMKVNG